MRATININDRIYEVLTRAYGRRGISKAVNELLAKVLFKPKKEMYGSLKKFSLSDLEIGDEEFE